MVTELKRRLAHRKGLLTSQIQERLNILAYSDRLPEQWRQRLAARFWEHKAESIHSEWGHGRDDYAALREVLRRYRPVHLLDAGCGSGRLFALYRECGTPHIVGVDVSGTALDIARNAFAGVELHRMDLTDLDFAPGSFDLCICNRVLQHVHPEDIRDVVQRLVSISRIVYVNELTESDELNEAFFMRRHDYLSLFAEAGLACAESGAIGKQTYLVFGHTR